MNVFICWSGDLSKKLANSLNDWLPTVIQAIKPFYSPDDIKKGEFWTGRLKEELKSNSTGILCITHENQDAPWILFEAGSLTNSIGKGKVCPLLFNIEITDLKGPLSLYNATQYGKDEMRKLLQSINSDLEEKVDDKVLDKVFEKMWPEFEQKINELLDQYKNKVPRQEKSRPDSDMIKEILLLQRESTKHNDYMNIERIYRLNINLADKLDEISRTLYKRSKILKDDELYSKEYSSKQTDEMAKEIITFAQSLGVQPFHMTIGGRVVNFFTDKKELTEIQKTELIKYLDSKGYSLSIIQENL